MTARSARCSDRSNRPSRHRPPSSSRSTPAAAHPPRAAPPARAAKRSTRGSMMPAARLAARGDGGEFRPSRRQYLPRYLAMSAGLACSGEWAAVKQTCAKNGLPVAARIAGCSRSRDRQSRRWNRSRRETSSAARHCGPRRAGGRPQTADRQCWDQNDSSSRRAFQRTRRTRDRSAMRRCSAQVPLGASQPRGAFVASFYARRIRGVLAFDWLIRLAAPSSGRLPPAIP